MIRVSDGALDFDEHGRALYQGKLFSGVAWESPSGDKYMSEIPYSDGLYHGVAVDWYSEDRVASRQEFQYGAKHGEQVEWFPDGTRRLEATWENGLCVRLRRWNPGDTTIAEEWELPADDPRRRLALDLQRGVELIGASIRGSSKG